MRLLYSFFTRVTYLLLHIVALFSPKMKLFVQGRKTVFGTLREKIQSHDKVVWFHSASLGEYEQALPIMEQVRIQFPQHKILLTFFSPSGYEIRRNTPAADVVVYLPMDTISNARRFMQLAHPDMAFFIKYEFWPNFLFELQKKNIPTYLISGLFRPNQAFFKWYGGFYRKAFKTFNHFFVQYESSKELLQSIGFTNASVSGDTRYDRVSRILEQDNRLPFIGEFKNKKLTYVFGSSWPADEEKFFDFINASTNIKFIIAPHTFGESHMQSLKDNITKPLVFFTEKEGKNLADYDVLVVNTIGLLGKIYSYAGVAYVGGGFGTAGLHNILEPAAFGAPIIIGPIHSKFPEAISLTKEGGCLVINNKEEARHIMQKLADDQAFRKETGDKAGNFVKNNRGAINHIMGYITQHHGGTL